MMKTQLSYLDLAAFYLSAKKSRDWLRTFHNPIEVVDALLDICDKLTCVIDAIRADGLDPRWNPERDALRGLAAGGDGGGGTKWTTVIDDKGAEGLVYQLHQRGYKIVKDK